MGLILDTDTRELRGLTLEERRESYYIMGDGVFVFGEDGTVEISKALLNKVVTFFERNPAERMNLKEATCYTERKP